MFFARTVSWNCALYSAKRLIKDRIMWAVNLGTRALLGVILYTPISVFLKLAPLSLTQLLLAFALAAASVLWYEVVKAVKRRAMGFELEEIKALKHADAKATQALREKMIGRIEAEKHLLDERIALIEDIAQNGFPSVELGLAGAENGTSFVEIISEYRELLKSKK